MINVKYIISEEEILKKGLKLAYLIENGNRIIRIYENLNVLPRVYLVSKIILVKDRKKVFKALTRPNFNPAEEIILEEIPNSRFQILNESQILNLKSKIKILDYQPNKVTIMAYSPIDCILFLNDTYYPGWKAYVDGRETKIYRANYIFRAIEFPAGVHKVEFIYFPTSFKAGLLGSIFTLILLVLSLSTTHTLKPLPD
jgi:hypothetical protein